MKRAVANITIFTPREAGEPDIEITLADTHIGIDLTSDVTEINLHIDERCIPDLVRLRDGIDKALAAAITASKEVA